MEIKNAVVSGSASALQLVKSLVQNPTLISTEAPYKYAISLECDIYRQYADADVAESVVISTDSDAKKYISDNVAPRAWTWELSGYIPGLELIEKTNLYTPIVATNRLFIRKTFEKGLRITFKDMYNKVWKNVVIQNLELTTTAECKNKQPFKMTLKKIDTLSQYSALSEAQELGAEMAESLVGALAGPAVSLGITACEQATAEKTASLNASLIA